MLRQIPQHLRPTDSIRQISILALNRSKALYHATTVTTTTTTTTNSIQSVQSVHKKLMTKDFAKKNCFSSLSSSSSSFPKLSNQLSAPIATKRNPLIETLKPNFEPTNYLKTNENEIDIANPKVVFLNRLQNASEDENKGTLSFQDVVQPNLLKAGFFMSFNANKDFLVQNLPQNIPFHFLINDEHANTPPLPNWGSSNWTLSFCRSVRANLMILFHETTVRIVVSSGMLQPEDWSVLENIIYLQDFPLNGKKTTTAIGKDYCSTLFNFLNENQAIDPSIAEKLKKANFDSAKVYLVPSRPGRHAKDGAQYGIEKLEALTKKDFHDNEEFLSSPITLQVPHLHSSTLKTDFLNDFVTACNGGLKTQTEFNFGNLELAPNIKKNKLIFGLASFETIRASKNFLFASPLGYFGAISDAFKLSSLCDITLKRKGQISNGTVLHKGPEINKAPGFFFTGFTFSHGTLGNYRVTGKKEVVKLMTGNHDIGVYVSSASTPEVYKNFPVSYSSLTPYTETTRIKYKAL